MRCGNTVVLLREKLVILVQYLLFIGIVRTLEQDFEKKMNQTSYRRLFSATIVGGCNVLDFAKRSPWKSLEWERW